MSMVDLRRQIADLVDRLPVAELHTAQQQTKLAQDQMSQAWLNSEHAASQAAVSLIRSASSDLEKTVVTLQAIAADLTDYAAGL